jgi:predicted RNase H-like nuclease
VRGVDGCRGGWLSVDVDRLGAGADARWRWWPLASTDELLHDTDVAVVAIDVPIGLPDAGRRACDQQARRLLGRRGVSVFPAPSRAVLGAPTYADARGILAARGGGSMSAQAFGIVPAVTAVDACLSAADDDRVVECHPEVSFCLLGGGPGLVGKRTAAGSAIRRQLLSSAWPQLDRVLRARPDRAPEDDVLDALACAWSALRIAAGQHVVLGDAERDARGLPMRIVG